MSQSHEATEEEKMEFQGSGKKNENKRWDECIIWVSQEM